MSVTRVSRHLKASRGLAKDLASFANDGAGLMIGVPEDKPTQTLTVAGGRGYTLSWRDFLDEVLDEGGGGRRELDSAQRAVKDRQLRRDVSEVDIVEHRH